MKPIEEIKAKLDKYPHVPFKVAGKQIEVLPADEFGFRVALTVNANEYSVFFDGWHEEFGSAEEAVRCFVFGLSSDCRLQVVFRGRFPCKWIVEGLENGEWYPDSETGLLIQPFWLSARTAYRQNHWINGRKK